MGYDYELDNLVEETKRFFVQNRIISLTYSRQFIAYSSRLFFAIGWSVIRNYVTNDEEQEVYDELIYRRSRRPGDSIEPGEFSTILRTLFDRHDREIDSAQEMEFVRKSVAYLSHAGKIRNVDYGHTINELDYKTFFNNFDELINEYREMLGSFTCEYLVPAPNCNSGSMMKCYVLGAEDRSARRTAEVPMLTNVNNPQDKLFYRLANETGNWCYCLTPFITTGNPEAFVLTKDPHFYIFEKLVNSNYANGLISIAYQRVIPSFSDPHDPSVFDRQIMELRLSDIIIHNTPALAPKSIWFGNREPYINVSQYPGFDEVVNNHYLYCDDICPMRETVMRFCRSTDKNKLLYVFGNGGLGKTALMLSVINELMNTTSSHYHFTNIIFLSAKKYIYIDDNRSHIAQLTDNSADIDSYESLLEKLSQMIGGASEFSSAEERREYILNNLFDYQDKSFLLIVDDFDSLSKEDQDSIEQLISDDNSGTLKTIITTRYIYPQDTWHVKLSKLDTEASLRFAKWYRNNAFPTKWDSWENREQAKNAVEALGKGNPLIIKKLVSLVAAGLEFQMEYKTTERESQKYFHNTVQNLLNTEQKVLFEICRRIIFCLPEDNRVQDISIRLPRYLFVGTGLDESAFLPAFEKLKDITLIVQTHPSVFRFESPFILEREVVSVGSVKIPKMYKYIERQMQSSPVEWFGYANVDSALFSTIIKSQSDPKSSNYDSVVAMRVLEIMRKDPDISSSLKYEIEKWISTNDTIDNPELKLNRMMEEVENTWAALKDVFDSDANDDALQRQLEAMIKKLSQELIKEPNQKIKDRLRVVQEEFESYL